MKRVCMKKLFLFAFAVVFLSCSSDGDSAADSADESPAPKPASVELSIQNESSYDLTDVSWRGITFYSSADGRTLPSSSVAKNNVEVKDDNDGGYVFFTRCGTVPTKLRTQKFVTTSPDKFTFTDNTLVVEVGNVKNTGTLSDIKLSMPDYYTVSFESDNEQYIEPYTVQRGKEIAVAPEVQKDGVAFAGWFLDKDFNWRVDFPYVPDSDAVLYAEWKSPPELVSCTGVRISSSCVELQITPSDDKYFDCYRVVCYKSSVTSRVASRYPSSWELFLDVKTKDSSYKIEGPDGTYLINLYVIDTFGQQSKVFATTF